MVMAATTAVTTAGARDATHLDVERLVFFFSFFFIMLMFILDLFTMIHG
jgi:hypothetical protein